MNAVTVTLPRRPESLGAARRLMAENATALSASRRPDAALLVSELVTNAMRHGRGTITLRIRHSAGEVWIEVADEGVGRLRVNPAPGADGGWGLHIVEELADAWGTHRGSTRVWFTMRVADAPRHTVPAAYRRTRRCGALLSDLPSYSAWNPLIRVGSLGNAARRLVAGPGGHAMSIAAECSP